MWLRGLFQANDDETAAAGASLASELGVKGRPIFEDIITLLNHRALQVRSFALDALMTTIRPEHGQ